MGAFIRSPLQAFMLDLELLGSLLFVLAIHNVLQSMQKQQKKYRKLFVNICGPIS